jgi:hypothetical protein
LLEQRIRVAEEGIARAAHRLSRAPDDFDPLLERIGDTRVMLLAFNAIFPHDHTRALEPLERTVAQQGEAPETYPYGV